jgi:Ca2+-transporting ATPase
MEKFYNKDISEIYEYFNSSIDGLDNEQCATNKKKYGINKIKESKKRTQKNCA